MALERPKQDLDVILSECEETEKVWTDPDFPAVKKSLCPPNEWNSITWKEEIEWIRASKIPSLTDEEGDNHVFTMKVNGEGYDILPADVMRGAIKDSYFISVLSCIAETPERIQQMFFSQVDEPSEWGVYAVQLTKNGIPTDVLVDDYIPCNQDEGEPIFANTRNGDLWVPLLEKAWAKLHGSYMRIANGSQTTVFRDLTGAPAYFVEFLHDETDYDDEGEEIPYVNDFDQNIEDALNHEMKPIVYLCSRSEKDYGSLLAAGQLGMTPDSAYIVLKILDIDEKKILHIRNAQALDSEFEKNGVECKWTGAWSQDSEEWTDQIKSDHLKDGDFEDGKFFMEWKDVALNHSGFGICVATLGFDGYLVNQKKTGPTAILKVTISESEGNSWFSLCQKGERMFPRNAGYKYSPAGMMIFKLKGKTIDDGVTLIETAQNQTRDMHLAPWQGTKYEKGEYYIIADVNWIEATKDKSFNVTVYGTSAVQFEDVTDTVDKVKILKKWSETKFKDFEKTIGKPEYDEDEHFVRYYDKYNPSYQEEELPEDYKVVENKTVYYLENIESKYEYKVIVNRTDQVWVERLTLGQNHPGITVLYPSDSVIQGILNAPGKQYEVKVKPGSEQHILMQYPFDNGYYDTACLESYHEVADAGSQAGSQEEMDEEEQYE